jgi:hypothetical protein
MEGEWLKKYLEIITACDKTGPWQRNASWGDSFGSLQFLFEENRALKTSTEFSARGNVVDEAVSIILGTGRENSAAARNMRPAKEVGGAG